MLKNDLFSYGLNFREARKLSRSQYSRACGTDHVRPVILHHYTALFVRVAIFVLPFLYLIFLLLLRILLLIFLPSRMYSNELSNHIWNTKLGDPRTSDFPFHTPLLIAVESKIKIRLVLELLVFSVILIYFSSDEFMFDVSCFVDWDVSVNCELGLEGYFTPTPSFSYSPGLNPFKIEFFVFCALFALVSDSKRERIAMIP